jgi:hypothetical protein
MCHWLIDITIIMAIAPSRNIFYTNVGFGSWINYYVIIVTLTYIFIVLASRWVAAFWIETGAF